jgi:hypothetical protein
MRSKLYSIALVSIVICLLFLNRNRSDSSDQHHGFNTANQFMENEEMDEMDKAIMQEIEKTKDPATGDVPIERLLIAEQIQQQKFAAQAAQGFNSPVPGVSWTERGPNNIGGRTRALMYDRNDPTFRKVWAGGVGGGLWYTNDITAATPVWNKVSDMFDNLAVTCIVQDDFEPNIMYFGTGEGWFSVQGVFGIRGLGIWKSSDGGASWTHLGSTTPTTINPTFFFIQDMKIGCCATVGTETKRALLVATKNGGVQQSTDGGASFNKVLGNGVGGGSTDEAADLEQVYSYIFATLGINVPGGIYRTANAGNTWDRIYQASGADRRIKIAAAPNQYWKQYALIYQSPSGIKIRKTTNADDLPANVNYPEVTAPSNWCDNGTTNPDFTRGQGWYDLAIAVDPWRADTVYIGAVDILRSTNAGASWSQLTQWKNGCGSLPFVHADIHEIVFRNPSPFPGFDQPDPEFLVACDGGIFRTSNVGANFTQRNNSYNITQYYGCAIHPTLANFFLAGGQDNGTQRFTAGGINSPPTISPPTTVSGGDGGFCHIDQDDGNTQFTSYSYNNFNVTSDGGAMFIAYNFPGGSFISPTDYDNVANILYGDSAAGQYFRWTAPFTFGTMSAVAVADFGGSRITHVRVSPNVSNRVYFGLQSGAIVRVNNANAVIASSVIKPAGGGPISCIDIDPGNENHILATSSAYGVSSVFETTTGAAPWTDLDGGEPLLPDMPVRWCMFDPRNSDWALIATEKGIWSTDNLNGLATDWKPTNNNFANTRVDMLQYRASDGTLLAATHGRGLFTAIIPAGSPTPITLLSFSGKLLGNDVLLNWETVTEQNSKSFEIEYSVDGTQFEKVGQVTAAGNSNTKRFYSYHDRRISQEKNYYRLKQIDLDEKFEYSKVVFIKNPIVGKETFKTLTNPFVQTIDVQLGNVGRGRAEFRLFDMNGKILLRRSMEIVQSSRIRIQLPNGVSSGVYNLEMILNGNRFSVRLVKK